MRTCKHLVEYLGKEYEDYRLRGVKGKNKRNDKVQAKSTQNKKAIKISLMLAQNYDPDKTDPTGYYMSEKMDGVRCYWDGKNMYSRAGN